MDDDKRSAAECGLGLDSDAFLLLGVRKVSVAKGSKPANLNSIDVRLMTQLTVGFLHR